MVLKLGLADYFTLADYFACHIANSGNGVGIRSFT